jgi:paraquat-inducible protein B
MSDQQPREQRVLPVARSQHQRRFPLIWLVPLITAAIGLWLPWATYSKRGPTITIEFDTGSGLQVGQSQLKYKDVSMGTVKAIDISPDYSKVVVTVETNSEAKRFLTDKTVFWVVKPQLFAGKVSGLDTLLSGSYIGMMPSPAGGEAKRHFIGQEDPPILTSHVPGTVFKLEASRVGAISLGSPIFYRDLEVGTVLGWDLGDMARHVTIHAFVRAPFDKYVHDDSLFWNASGVQVKLGASGVKVEMESFRALLLGGIAFDTRPSPSEKPSEAKHSFPLYANHDAALNAGFGRKIHFVSFFEGSVAGLEPGADVTIHGLKIGEVTEVGLFYDAKTDRILVPVHYVVEGDRVSGVSGYPNVPSGVIAGEMVRRGFRATLQAPSLISSSKIIAFDQVPDAPAAEMRRDGDAFVIPTAPGAGFESLTRAAGEIMSKLNQIDYSAIGRDITNVAKGLDQTINGPQIKNTLASLQATMKDVQDFSRKLDVAASPALAKLPNMAAQLDEALTKVNKLAGSINTAYGDDSRFSRDLDRLMPQLNDMARSIRALTDLLARHPEALITGRPTGKE